MRAAGGYMIKPGRRGLLLVRGKLCELLAQGPCMFRAMGRRTSTRPYTISVFVQGDSSVWAIRSVNSFQWVGAFIQIDAHELQTVRTLHG